MVLLTLAQAAAMVVRVRAVMKTSAVAVMVLLTPAQAVVKTPAQVAMVVQMPVIMVAAATGRTTPAVIRVKINRRINVN